MNTVRTRTLAFVLPLAVLFLGGCLEFESSTSVHRDGSLERTVTVTGDSSEIARGDFPVVLDSSWSFTRDTTSDGKHRLTARQTFADAAAMTATLNARDGLALRVTATLEHSFEWFSDVYTYTETWHRFDPFDAVPVTQYLSAAELDMMKRHYFDKATFDTPGDSLAMKDVSARFEEWVQRNRFESFYAVFLEGMRRGDASAQTAKDALEQKPRLYEASAEALAEGKLDEAKEAFASVLGEEAVAAAFAANPEGSEDFGEKLRFASSVWRNGYAVRVRMPGLLIDANAPSVEGSTAVWDDYINLCYFQDATMYARSQALNWWLISLAIVVSALILAFLIAAALRGRKR